MSPAFVRTPRDEELWAQAKERAAAAGMKAGSESFWAYTNATFQRMKGRAHKSESGIVAFMRDGTTALLKARPHSIVEWLAELEHEQWMHWSKAIAARGVVDKAQVAKWRRDWVPYAELDDATKEFDRVWARKALARIKESGLAKSHRNKTFAPDRPAKTLEREVFEPKGSLEEAARPRAVLDGHALVQRPDHPQAVAGRVVAVGRDGIHLRDDGGRLHRVRHEHVLDHEAPIGEEEWVDAAEALHRQGVPIDVDERFAAKTSGEQDAMLDGIKESGMPIDVDRLKKDGSAADISELVDRHVNKEPRPSELPTVVSADRQREAPGWEQVHPEGNGRVSRQRRPPKRLYADDNDRERDGLFEQVKASGMVAQVRLHPESDPAEQEHLLRYAANALRSIAEVVGPPSNPPTLVVAPPGVEAQGEEPGAHYNRRSNTLELGLGEPESLVHAYGHVFDAAFGNGQYASTETNGPLGRLMASLREAKGTSDLDVSLATAGRREEEPPDSPRRFWTGPAELFARFFEQFVDESLSGEKPQPHHEYVRGVEQPGSLSAEEMAAASAEFRRLLGGRDKRRTGVRKITAEQPRDRSAKPDELAPHLLEEAKGEDSESARRVVSALTHGVHSRHVLRAPAHYDDERAGEHEALVRRARKRLGNDGDKPVQPLEHAGHQGRDVDQGSL